jgi:hypothetical protein
MRVAEVELVPSKCVKETCFAHTAAEMPSLRLMA